MGNSRRHMGLEAGERHSQNKGEGQDRSTRGHQHHTCAAQATLISTGHGGALLFPKATPQVSGEPAKPFSAVTQCKLESKNHNREETGAQQEELTCLTQWPWFKANFEE